MKREKLITFLKDNAAEIRGYGVKSLALFGSVARDEATTKSDVDLLVEFEGKVTFDCYMNLKFWLFRTCHAKLIIDLRQEATGNRQK
jgi:predicted nucleotidyltransferase